MAGISKRVSGAWVSGSERIMKTATDIIVPPTTIYTDGTNATVGLKGNMVQTGTPTPSAPIMPQVCGDRTGNLFDASLLANNKQLDNTTGLPVSYPGRIASLNPVDVSQYEMVTLSYEAEATTKAIYSIFSNDVLVGRFTSVSSGTAIDVSNADKMYICFYSTWGGNLDTSSVSNIMLNPGSTALPYEPYGFKIPISSANTTTPVYLGEVESTRRIKKYKITGQENWELHSTQANLFRLLNFDGYLFELKNILVCNTYKSVVNGGAADVGDKQIGFYFSSGAVSHILYIRDSSYSTATDFKTYLQQQYAAGTPVTIWYVLATEETGMLNEPIRKIGDYADKVSGIAIPTIAGANTLAVDTTLQPSEVTATYHGWHEGTVKDYENGDWQPQAQALSLSNAPMLSNSLMGFPDMSEPGIEPETIE